MITRFGMAAALITTVASHSLVYGQASVLTWHNDNARTGQNLQETALTHANVNKATFGKLFVINVDGKVDAQPLYVPLVSIPGKGAHNVLYVATEHDSVYAFDADNGTQFWHVSVLKSAEMPSDNRSCDQVTPEIGVTGTPVIDRTHGPNGAIYLIAMSTDGSGNYFQRLHALDLASGAELFGGPKDIQAKYPGKGDNSDGTNVIFDAKQYKSRPGLLLLNGIVYTAWGSHCDAGPYTGWVMGYDPATLAQKIVLNIVPNGSEGGIWMSGAGLAADGSGNIYLLAGNGDFADSNQTLDGNGFPANGNYGNAFLKLSTWSGLWVADYFEMDNEVGENGSDADLGSGGAMVVPDQTDGSGKVWRLAVGAGKDGHLYLVNRNSMGKFSSSNNNIYQDLAGALPGGVWSAPAYFNGAIYYGSVGQPVSEFQFANAALLTAPVAQTGHSFSYPGAIPSISANNTADGIVWATDNTNPAVLYAYDATNLNELYNSNQATNSRDHFGAGNKFIAPTIANGKVYVGTTNGVGVFGLLCGGSAVPLSANVALAGGNGMFNVAAPSACGWTASSNDSFINITNGTTGTGNGSVSYTVSPNGGIPRNGTITAAGQTFTVIQAGSTPSPIDFNGDGHPDVVWQDPVTGASQVSFLGGAQGTTTIGSAGLSGSNPWRIVGVADFNGDGHPDLIWQDPVTGTSQVWFMGGTQGVNFLGWAGLSGANAWRIAAVADLNGDGHPDLIWQDPATGTSRVWFMGGSQGVTFLGSAALSGPNPWRIVGATDMNGDGHPDLIWQDPATGTSQVWFMSGTQGVTFLGWAPLGKPNPWRIVGVADLNGDGHPDLIWQDPATGTSQVWFMSGTQGTTFLGWAWLSGPNAWRIVK